MLTSDSFNFRETPRLADNPAPEQVPRPETLPEPTPPEPLPFPALSPSPPPPVISPPPTRKDMRSHEPSVRGEQAEIGAR